jgi:hypothetical protein
MAVFSQEKRRFSIDSTSQQQEICSRAVATLEPLFLICQLLISWIFFDRCSASRSTDLKDNLQGRKYKRI